MNEHSFINIRRTAMPHRKDRKKQITKLRQEQILDAALLVFSRLGYDRSTIPDVAREASVAVGTIYNYYPSKRELLVALTDKYIIEPFTRRFQQTRATDDATFIATLLEDRLHLGLDSMKTFLPLLIEVQRDPELCLSYIKQVQKPIMDIMEQYAILKMKAGAFREINPAIMTRAVMGMVIGFMLLCRIEGEKSPVYKLDRKKLAFELAEFVLRGLQNN
jgi:AcrR family transcriptional regulator